jgi:membrane protein implicated in regulation of membrane protease activity
MQLQLVLLVVLSLLTVLIGEREVRGVPRRAT